MSVVGTVRNTLIDDYELASLLASTPDGQPAIFRNWVSSHARPYVSIMYQTMRSSHWAIRRGPLDLDIFADGPSTVRAEQIRDRIVFVLDRLIVPSMNSPDLLRLYLNTDGEVPTASPEVAHWNVQFEVRFYRQAFVEALLSR